MLKKDILTLVWKNFSRNDQLCFFEKVTSTRVLMFFSRCSLNVYELNKITFNRTLIKLHRSVSERIILYACYHYFRVKRLKNKKEITTILLRSTT